MNDYIISKYINNITLNNINDFAKKEGILLKNDELNTINFYIKNHWKTFYYGNPENLFKELKEKLEEKTNNKVIELYNEYKKRLNN